MARDSHWRKYVNQDEKSRRLFLKGFGGMAAAGMFAGCTGGPSDGAATESPGDGMATTAGGDGTGGGREIVGSETVTMAPGVVSTLDPHIHSGGANTIVDHTTYEQLIWNNPYTGEPMPVLASGWEKPDPDDPNLLRIYIREGIEFHDGSPLTLEDVVFNFRRKFEPGNYDEIRQSPVMADDLPQYESVEIVDDEHAVDLRVSNPFLLVQFVGETVMVMNKEWTLSRSLEELGREQNGTGAWAFDEYEEGVEVNYVRHDDWWAVQEDFDPHPDYPTVGWTWIENVNYQMTDELATRVNQLLAGETDVVKNVPIADLGRVQNSDIAHISTVATDRDMFFAMRNVGDDDPPGTSHDFRLAMNWAIDTQVLVDDVLEGFGKALAQPVPDFWHGYKEYEWSPYGYHPQDLDKAEQLIDSSGYAGIEFEIGVSQGSYLGGTRLVEAAVGMVNELPNITASTNIVPSQRGSELLTLGRENLEDMPWMWMWGWGDSPPDGTVKINGNWNSDTAPLGDWCMYHNPEINSLMEEATNTLDDAARAELIQEAVQILHDDAAAVFTHRQAGLYGLNNKINWSPAPNEDLYPDFMEPSDT